MKSYNDEIFNNPIHDYDTGRVFAGAVFRNCEFSGCSLSRTDVPSLRSTIRNVELKNTVQHGCAMGPAVIEEVTIDTMRGSMFQTWGAVYKHVVLKGKIGGVMCSNLVDPAFPESKVQAAFDEANAQYYQDVDWALDISEAVFVGADFRGVPAKLIRRDPETQAVVTRQKALEGNWKELDIPSLWYSWIQQIINRGHDAEVLVAAKRRKDLKELVAGLAVLRREGVAEPD